MKVFNKIIQSDAEPSRNNIWFKDKKLWFYNNNGWEALTDEVGKPADLTGYLKESDIAQNIPGDYKIPGLFPLTSDGMKQMLVRSPSRFQFYVNNIPITEVGPDTNPLEQFFQSEYDTKFNRISVNLPTAEGIDPYRVADSFQYMVGKNNLLVSMGFLHEMLARMLSGSGGTLGWRYLSFADINTKEESLYPSTGEPIDWSASGVDNCTITRSVHYFNGTRDMSSTATNIVQEKGLYTVINNFRDTIFTDLVYTMPDIALNTLDSTTNMASLLTDEQADKMFKCSYIKFNLKKMSGEHVIGTLPITCSCSSLGFSEKIFQTPTLSIGNTDFTNIKITVKKMTPEGGTEEHWYAVLETV